MLTPKRIALQLADAMPDDASLEDYAEFLFERGQVEQGRHDLVSKASTPPTGAIGSIAAAWSDTATEGYRTLAAVAGTLALEAEVVAVLGGVVSGAHPGVSLPEMGDPAILEVRVRVKELRCRLLYEKVAGSLRVLWFTNNVTCYRNVRPDARHS